MYSIGNPKREIKGVRIENKLTSDNFKEYFGVSYYDDLHKSRMAGGKTADTAKNMLKSKEFSKNLKFYNTAYFAQGEYFFDNAGLFGGYRHERVKVRD